MKKPRYTSLLAIVLLSITNMGCSIQAEKMKQSDMAESERVVAKQFEKWKSGEAGFFDLLADDVHWVVSGRSPVSGTYLGKKDFMERAVNPIVSKFKTPLAPELISLTSDSSHVWLHFKSRASTHTSEVYENTYVWKMQLKDGKITNAVAFLDTYELTNLMNQEKLMSETIEETKAYIGMWVTKDGQIRHELLPDNRYDEARGNRKSAYQGSYKVTGNHIDYKDDTGFTADGDFKDGNLHHGGMIFYKEK
ncbi:MAG: FIG00984080: hypothetical protein [uncultured Adhaeribacter sp.]|uniref:SnoaL-like domain-containing protein n=1 Tax=uncultured Adhaeribacter sp. TaxID=448109 RepID=A0A6J4JR51_9BACT|nr:MAG: FIG00984080: hypothetical protein [uncultured Adhaeribacter sp.]